MGSPPTPRPSGAMATPCSRPRARRGWPRVARWPGSGVIGGRSARCSSSPRPSITSIGRSSAFSRPRSSTTSAGTSSSSAMSSRGSRSRTPSAFSSPAVSWTASARGAASPASIVIWSISAMAHAAGANGGRIQRRALRARHRRVGKFPGVDQDGGRVVPAARARAGDRNLQRGLEHRRDRHADPRAVDRADLGVAGVVHRHRRARLSLARGVACRVPPACRAPQVRRGRARAHSERRIRRAAAADQVVQAAQISARPGRSRSASFSPIRSGGSISTGCRNSSTRATASSSRRSRRRSSSSTCSPTSARCSAAGCPAR